MKNTIKEKLRQIIPEDLLDLVPKSFDILGSKGEAVAIIEIPPEMKLHQIEIADAIMEVHHNVKSVLNKESERHGEYRNREYQLIKGDPNTSVIHRESGCRFRLDPTKTYFSSRESTERERISSIINSGEKILVMFSGVGPYPICIAREHPDVKVTAIELNPDAHYYCIENIRLNKVTDRVTAVLGDVREICPKLEDRFDRVVMPLPKGAYQFLDITIPLMNKGGVIHFYHWAPEDQLFEEAEKLVSEAVKHFGRQSEIIDRVKVSKYSPRMCKVRIDAKIH